jgi:hypothetical protein
VEEIDSAYCNNRPKNAQNRSHIMYFHINYDMVKKVEEKLKEWMKTWSDACICPQKLNAPMKIR